MIYDRNLKKHVLHICVNRILDRTKSIIYTPILFMLTARAKDITDTLSPKNFLHL
jgi:hypothetical protein